MNEIHILERPESIIARTERAFGLREGSILARDQHRSTSTCRNTAMLLMRERGMSYPEIARSIGLKDHTTVMSGVRSITMTMRRDARVQEIVNALRADVSSVHAQPALCAQCARTLHPTSEKATSLRSTK